MSAKTKIVVLHMKELIYTGIFTALGVLLIVLLFVLFLSGDSTTNSTTPNSTTSSESATDGATNESATDATTVSYIPGIYTTQLSLGTQTVDVEVILDKHSITSISLVNLDESIATMYPLLESTFDTLCEQIYTTQSTEGLSYSSENKYTSIVLLNAIQEAIDKGKSTTDSTETSTEISTTT